MKIPKIFNNAYGNEKLLRIRPTAISVLSSYCILFYIVFLWVALPELNTCRPVYTYMYVRIIHKGNESPIHRTA